MRTILFPALLACIMATLPVIAVGQPLLHSSIVASGSTEATVDGGLFQGALGETFIGTSGGSNGVLQAGFWPRVHASRRTVSTENPSGVTEFALASNYPNPFTSSTRISYEIAQPVHVRLVVYNVLGQEITILTDQLHDTGRYELDFVGNGLASGVYLYQLTAGNFRQVRRMLLVR